MRYTMRYEDLTVHQRISLKGFFWTNEKLINYRIIWLLWNYKHAVNFFLDETYTLPISWEP